MVSFSKDLIKEIPKLMGNLNYKEWARQIELVLRAEGLWDHTDGTAVANPEALFEAQEKQGQELEDEDDDAATRAEIVEESTTHEGGRATTDEKRYINDKTNAYEGDAA